MKKEDINNAGKASKKAENTMKKKTGKDNKKVIVKSKEKNSNANKSNKTKVVKEVTSNNTKKASNKSTGIKKSNTKKNTGVVSKDNKKVCDIGMYVIISLLLVAITIICTFNILSEFRNNELNNKLYFVPDVSESEIDLDEVIQTKSRLKEIFGELDFEDELDFINHNYAILQLDYNPCSQEKLTPNVKKIFGKNIEINVTYNSKCGECPDQKLYYLISVSKYTTHVNINVNYKKNNVVLCK